MAWLMTTQPQASSLSCPAYRSRRSLNMKLIYIPVGNYQYSCVCQSLKARYPPHPTHATMIITDQRFRRQRPSKIKRKRGKPRTQEKGRRRGGEVLCMLFQRLKNLGTWGALALLPPLLDGQGFSSRPSGSSHLSFAHLLVRGNFVRGCGPRSTQDRPRNVNHGSAWTARRVWEFPTAPPHLKVGEKQESGEKID